jgi:suppressor of ftsI
MWGSGTIRNSRTGILRRAVWQCAVFPLVGFVFLGRSTPAACRDQLGLAAATAPNYCVALIPTPDLENVTGVLELRPVETPFGVAVTADGRPRYRLATTIADLPAPSSLGRYRTYVAWVTTLSLDSVVKLGPVHNGQTVLGEVSSSQFRFLISAESSAAVPTRSGRLVLRALSPSSRLLAHRDVTQLFGLGRPEASISAGVPVSDTTRGHGAPAMQWSMPPMDVATASMPPVPGLEPMVQPWRAGSELDLATLPPARAGTEVHLRSGDTLALTASLVRRSIEGRTFAAYAYNGEIPGPLMVVPQGASIVVQFHNATDLATTVHWHGVRLDNANDGTDGVTQDAIPPDSSFTYHLRFPDAGVYWYHAHHREDIAQPLGLYGNILVAPVARDGSAPSPPVNRQEVLTIGDILLDQSGPAAWGDTAPTNALMGRFGNTILVNGQWRPQWTFERGDVVRFILTNVSAARPYNLSFGPARMKVIGSDGGRFEREAWVSSVVIAPAERYVVDVQFPVAGEFPLTNRVEALSHMTGVIFPEVDTLGFFRVRAGLASPDRTATFRRLRVDSGMVHDLARYAHDFARPVDRELYLQMRVQHLPLPIAAMLDALSVAVDWNDGMGMMNWAFTPREVTWVLHDPASGRDNMAIDWHFRQGDVVKLRVTNDASMPHAMDHVLHLHGQRFLVLARNGVAITDLVWKDTVLIPAGETVDLLLDLANPGRWLLHCHIAEHMESGMMTSLTVDPSPS